MLLDSRAGLRGGLVNADTGRRMVTCAVRAQRRRGTMRTVKRLGVVVVVGILGLVPGAVGTGVVHAASTTMSFTTPGCTT